MPDSTAGAMTVTEIEQSIPHRLPMRLIDEVISLEDRRIVCRKRFGDSEFFVQGHFPSFPIVPGVIQCECCLQAGAILLSKLTPTGGSLVPVVTRMDKAKFRKMVRPGDSIEIDVTLDEVVGNAYFLTGKVMLDGKLAARLDFAVTVTDAREVTKS